MTSSSNGGHQHSVGSSLANVTLAYVDVIQCSKDSAGAPYAYEDVTSGVFGWKKLVSKQKLNKLAKNDAHILFHTMESGTKAFFFMATVPITWTRITTQNDKALRIVSGSSGGSAGGGSQLMSVAIPLAHTHTIIGDSHTHTISHSHASDKRTESNAGIDIQVAGKPKRVLNQGGVMAGGSIQTVVMVTVAEGFGSASATTDSATHDHGGVSSSSLSDVTLAYIDVLYATKE